MLFSSRVSPLLLLVTLATCLRSVMALHFYLDADEKRCFVEELPSDTVVEGHYKALEWDETTSLYVPRDELGIQVDVDEMATDEPVVRTRGPHDGRFTFTSHEAGDHSICLSTNYTSGWLSTSRHIKLYLDIVVGGTKRDVEHDRTHVGEVAGKIRDLNERLATIRREQQYQREREAQYRDLSEQVNGRAVYYTVAQILVLFATCTWQLRHLKRFFEVRKLR